MGKIFKIPKLKKFTIVLFFIILFLLFIFSIIFSFININNTKILNGVLINGIDVSGLSKDEATDVITEIINKKTNNNIILSNDENTENTATFESLEINYNINSYINEAFNIGRSGNIFKNNFEILNLMLNKKNITTEVALNEDKLNELIEQTAANLPNKLIQSSYYIENDNLIITKGSSGDVVDSENLKNKIYDTLNDWSTSDNIIKVPTKQQDPNNIDIEQIYNEIYKEPKNAYYEKNPFKIYPEIVGISFDKDEAISLLQNEQEEYIIKLNYSYPEITINDLGIDTFKDTLSNFTTKYDMSNTDRSNNLELAASKINGTILAPGEEFSYNKIVGARTISTGYKEAKIYSNGQVVDGVGGGICQISSTLYNSVVRANLDVTERHNHQFVTSYVPAGRDSTVVYGAKDLKFVNNRSFPIKIEMKATNTIISCSIYGLKEETEYDVDFNIELVSQTEPKVVYEYDDSVNLGKEQIKQSGALGKVVNVYKIVKSNGNVISKTLLSQDTYNPLEKIVLKNPADKE